MTHKFDLMSPMTYSNAIDTDSISFGRITSNASKVINCQLLKLSTNN